MTYYGHWACWSIHINVRSSEVENNIKIYPNPANEILNIEFVTLSGVEASTTNYSILNSLGQVIKEEILQPTQQANGSVYAAINTKELANGVYVLISSSPHRGDMRVAFTKRFIIAR